ALCFWDVSVKRLRFLIGTIAVAVGALVGRTLPLSARAKTVSKLTWAEYIQDRVNTTGSRRFEHPIHMAVCHGDRDHHYSPVDRARRRARCARICGLCRFIHSPQVWPDQNYRRP